MVYLLSDTGTTFGDLGGSSVKENLAVDTHKRYTSVVTAICSISILEDSYNAHILPFLRSLALLPYLNDDLA